VELYLDNCDDTLVQRNLIYHTKTGNPFFDGEWGGIALDDEPYLHGNPRLGQRRTIINNIIIGCGGNFKSWGAAGHGLIDDVIAGNTFINAGQGATGNNVGIKINPSNSHSGTIIKDNIIIQDTGVLADVPNDPNLDFDYNCWYNGGTSIPEADARGANDVNDNPDLVDHDHTLTPGVVNANWYKLTAPSPCRSTGVVVTEVTEDYWKTIRSDPPDIGAHEYDGGAPTPTPTPTFIPTPPPIPGDLDGDGDVDIFDLIIVGSHFGEDVGIPCTLDPCPDADSDGDVDIFDLITVGSHFGEGDGMNSFQNSTDISLNNFGV
jgi:hypothetical protein